MHRVLVVLIVALAVTTTVLFIQGLAVPAVLGWVVTAGLVGWGAVAARNRPSDPTASPTGAPKPATVPPDGHIRFTLVVEGLNADRLAAAWSDLCRPDLEPPDELRLLFRTFTVVEGLRFRFLKGDPAATATLLRDVLWTATGVAVRTRLEPAAERTAVWG